MTVDFASLGAMSLAQVQCGNEQARDLNAVIKELNHFALLVLADELATPKTKKAAEALANQMADLAAGMD
jgi:hypothetical protein